MTRGVAAILEVVPVRKKQPDAPHSGVLGDIGEKPRTWVQEGRSVQGERREKEEQRGGKRRTQDIASPGRAKIKRSGVLGTRMEEPGRGPSVRHSSRGGRSCARKISATRKQGNLGR